MKFWQDTNKDGTLDSQLGGTASHVGGVYSVSGISLNVASGTSEWVLATVDIASGATNGDTCSSGSTTAT